MFREFCKTLRFVFLERRFISRATRRVEAAEQINEIEPEIKVFESYVQSGDELMQCYLGCIYARMDKDWYNPGKAAEYLEPLAEKGMLEAQFQMGMLCFVGGPGMNEDQIIGLHWMRKAAEQGHPLAAEFLRMREEGFNTPSRYVS